MNYLKLFALVGLLTVLMAASSGCTSTAEPIETEADFIGFITEIHPTKGRDVHGQLFVESHADKIVTRYVITITDETLIFQQDTDYLRVVDFKALENKQWIEIWWAEPPTGTFTVEGIAAQVVIQ
jgi:hypothetical protein